MVETDPKEIKGPWGKGYVLDKHTLSSTMIGYNEYGHPEYDTQRSPLGELVYRLKYKRDNTCVESIVDTVAEFVKKSDIQVDLIIPMPPSKQRLSQPLFEIADALSKKLGIPTDTKLVSKTKGTPQMKDIGDYSERVAALKDAFTVDRNLAGKRVLLIDDLYQSGASASVVAAEIQKAGARAVHFIALTRTRS